MSVGKNYFSHGIGATVGARNIKVDVLLVQCWMMRMNDFVRGVNPLLIICGYENEMGHTIDHREAYWLTFKQISEVKTPFVVSVRPV